MFQVRRLNMYRQNDPLHTGQDMDYYGLHECLDQVLIDSEYELKKKEVDEFNRLVWIRLVKKHVKKDFLPILKRRLKNCGKIQFKIEYVGIIDAPLWTFMHK